MWFSLPFAQIARPIGQASRATSTTTAMTIARRRRVRARGAPSTADIGRAGVDAVRDAGGLGVADGCPAGVAGGVGVGTGGRAAELRAALGAAVQPGVVVRGGFGGRDADGATGGAGRAGRPTGTASSAAGGRDCPAAGAQLGGLAGAPGRVELGAGLPVGLTGRADPPVRARDAALRFSASSDGMSAHRRSQEHAGGAASSGVIVPSVCVVAAGAGAVEAVAAGFGAVVGVLGAAVALGAAAGVPVDSMGTSLAMLAQMGSAALVHTTRFGSLGAGPKGIVMKWMSRVSFTLKARPDRLGIDASVGSAVIELVAALRNRTSSGMSVSRFLDRTSLTVAARSFCWRTIRPVSDPSPSPAPLRARA